MKRFIITLSLLFLISDLRSQVYWDGGGGDGLWETATNWNTNTVPTAADDVVLDNSIVSGNYVVTLPNTSVDIISLVISPATGNTIHLLLPSSNVVTAGAFITTGTGYSVTIDNGGIFDNNSGATSGTNLTINDTFRINNGGRYIHRTRSGHAGWVARLAKITGTENGTFEFDVTIGSYTLSFSGRTFGNLVLSSQTNGTVGYIASGGSDLTVNGNFHLFDANTSLSLSMSANVVIKGNYTQDAFTTFDLQSSSNNNTIRLAGNVTINGDIIENGTGLPVLELNGTTNQNITVTGSITNNVALTINNASGATLNSPLTIPYNLNLVNGKITTTSTSLLTMVDDAIWTWGGSNSFVDGPLKKIGEEAFIFPVGKGNMYAPIGTADVTGGMSTDAYTAEYFRTNPQSLHGSCPANCDPSIDHISFVEYWKFTQDNGSATVRLVIAVHQYSFCLEPTTTFISRWNGTQWTNEPATPTGVSGCGTYQCFNLTSNADVSGFGEFTLATTDNFTTNPLPIDLVYFDAIRINKDALVKWELVACCSKDATFEVQRSYDGRNFTTFNRLPGSETSVLYQISDRNIKTGITYFRLKMIDEAGQISYSKTVAVLNGSSTLQLISLVPTVVTNTAQLIITSEKDQKAVLFILDAKGEVVFKSEYNLSRGNRSIEINLERLSSGIYYLHGVSERIKTNVIRFVKQ